MQVMEKAVYAANLFGTVRGEELRKLKQGDISFRSEFAPASFNRLYKLDVFGSKTQKTLASGRPGKSPTIVCQCIDEKSNPLLTVASARAFNYEVAKVCFLQLHFYICLLLIF